VISERPDHRLEPPRTIYVVPVAGNFPDRQLNVTSKLTQKTDSMGYRMSAVICCNLPPTPCIAFLKMTFRGGLYMGIPQKAVFTFICDPSIVEVSVKLDITNNQNLYKWKIAFGTDATFTWRPS
jgi:hypothetical protein